MSEINKYRLYCVTEGANVEGWGETIPTFCYNNNTHTISTSSITMIDTVSSNIVQIKEETVITGGRYRTNTYSLYIAAGVDVVSSMTFSQPFNTSLLLIVFRTKDEHEGDIINANGGPNAVVGALMSAVSEGMRNISVPQITMENVFVGCTIDLFDGVNNDNLGKVITVDYANNELGMEIATSNFFNVGSLIRRSIHTVEDYEIGPAGIYKFGENKISGMYFPANAGIRFDYTNKSNVQKKLVLQVDILY